MIHKYNLGGFKIVIDVNSESVHIVDDLTYDILDNLTEPFGGELSTENSGKLASENSSEISDNSVGNNFGKIPGELPAEIKAKLLPHYGETDLVECYGEIKELAQAGQLFSGGVAAAIYTEINTPIKSMCLNVAHTCNMHCSYCFAEKVVGENSLMSFEVGKAAIDFLISKSESRKNLEIDFFGGEPLLNWTVVKNLVAYGREQEKIYDKHINFTLTTNCILLDDEKIDFINKEIYNIVLSIDGREEVHNRVRKSKTSYEQIVENAKKLIAARELQTENNEYYIRGTFTKHNLDFADDVYALYDFGFKNISIEPVVCKEDTDFAITEAELATIFKEYERLAERLIKSAEKGEDINFFHFNLDLENSSCLFKRIKGCGCGLEYIAVTPNGDIYPCHQFVEKDRYLLGNVLKNDYKKCEEFFDSNIFTKHDCKECWAKFHCCGGCDANNFEFTGDIKTPNRLYCELMKKRLECAYMIKARTSAERIFA
ncbi:MAG: thioether cross-link-forming SCIFF peptide maturase [Ruminococcus sp.]|jgi:uncharacterized protein|nr:thioether cross-link-forming SCIFF peptide maturase [Ruminococcus sp.]